MAGEWRESTVAREVEILLGFAFKSAEFATEPPGHRLVRGDNVKRNTLEWGEKTRYWRNLTPDLDRYQLRTGDVVVGMDGSRVGENFARIAPEDLPALLVQRVACLRARGDLDQRFLRYLICNPAFTAYIKAVQTGTSIPHISSGQIGDYPISVPPADDQRAIAQILGTLDDKIELNRRMNETLEAMARALFKSWFVDFEPVRAKAEGRDSGLPREVEDLFPNRFEGSALGEIPQGWAPKRWIDLVTLEYGKSLAGSDRSGGPYPVYGTNGRIGFHSEPLCAHPGIIIGRKGAYRGVHFSSEPFYVIDTAFYVEPVRALELRWVYYEMLRQDLNLMDSGSAIPSTSREEFYNLPIVHPPYELQKVFTSLLLPAWAQQVVQDKQSRTLLLIRDALLPKLISGELSATDAEQFLGARAYE